MRGWAKVLGIDRMTVETQRNLGFHETPERTLTLDLHRPEDGDPTAGVVFVHGGGWRGDRNDQFRRHAIHLAERDYVCIDIDYRLRDDATFPAAVQDVVAAIGWLRSREPEVDDIALVGGSAGGHLAALAALSPDQPEFQPEHPPASDVSTDVQAVVAFNGVFDFVARGREFLASEYTVADLEGDVDELGIRHYESATRFMGATYDEMPAQYELASPMNHVGSGAPPFFLLHGTEDEIVPYDQCLRFRERLVEAGAAVELFTAEGAPHGFYHADEWYERTMPEVESFLTERMPP